MNIRKFFGGKQKDTESSAVNSELVGKVVSHYQLSIPRHPLEVPELICSEATIKKVKANGNILLNTVSIDGKPETGEYRKINPEDHYYTRIDRPGNPLNEQAFM